MKRKAWIHLFYPHPSAISKYIPTPHKGEDFLEIESIFETAKNVQHLVFCKPKVCSTLAKGPDH